MMMGKAAVVYYEMLCRNLPKGAEDDYRIHVTISGFRKEATTCFVEGLDRISAQKLTTIAELSVYVTLDSEEFIKKNNLRD
jgi:hypothetical protein